MKRKFNGVARLTHIALHVGDIDRSAAFYRDWCGMTEVSRRDSQESGDSVVWMACPDQEDDFVIVLLSGAAEGQVQAARERMRHLGFSVPSRADVKDLAEKARAEGVLHWDYQEHKHPVGTLCAVRDPDGHVVEFSYGQPLGRDFRNAANDNVENNEQPRRDAGRSPDLKPGGG